MYISNVYIKNIRCFHDVNIPLDAKDGKPSFWSTILGDNGTGKTTAMRCIALGLCDKSDYSGLLQEIYGEWISDTIWMTDQDKKGTIRIDLISDDFKEKYSIETTIEKKESGSFEIEQVTDPNPFPWDDIFVCGYGAARRAFGTKDYSDYFSVDAIYTLFNYDSPLQNPELILRRLKDPDQHEGQEIDIEILLEKIANILTLEKGSITLAKKGIEINGPWGKFVPLGATADGYHATLSWIVDMLGWAMFHDIKMFRTGLTGIVLLDEIEQHLHPSWQRKIVPLIKRQFPKIQFISTTHSPLVAANARNFLDKDSKSRLFHLSYDKTGNKISEIEEDLDELNFDQVLSSEAFGHIFSVNPNVEKFLRDASLLASKDKRTDKEELRFKNIKEKLREVMFPKGKTLIERVVEREYYSDLEKRIADFNKIMEQK